MPYASVRDLPAAFKALPTGAKTIAMETMNAVLADKTETPELLTQAIQAAWANIKRKYRKEGEEWVQKSALHDLATRFMRWLKGNPETEGKRIRVTSEGGILRVSVSDTPAAEDSAVPTGPFMIPAAGEEVTAEKALYADIPGSLEATCKAVSEAVCANYTAFGATEPYEASVAATFPDSVIVQGKNNSLTAAQWKRDEQGAITFSNIGPCKVMIESEAAGWQLSPGGPSYTEPSNTPQPVTFAKSIPITKVDLERRLVYGIVLEPGDPEHVDAQGDWLKPEEIEQSCHEFMKRYRAQETKMRLQHEQDAPKVSIVECYIAPADFVLGEQAVLKGSWVVASHVNDEQLWEQVKAGELTGYSIGGVGERES
jgi:cation transport regulator ChaB